MSRIAFLAVIMALSAQSALASSQQEPPHPTSDPTTQLEDVIVQGTRLRDAVDQFVHDIVAPPAGHGPARWDKKVCVGVANLTPALAQAIADQISVVAVEAGLEAGEPGCSPNILVIAADDGRMMAQALVQARPRVFRPNYAGASRSANALERFQNTTAPVRWWHVSVPVNSWTGEVAVRIPGSSAPLTRQDGGRLTTLIQNDLRRAFVIVDINQVSGLSANQLGDYIAMVALAQIDPDAETASYDTILNLFDDGRADQELTDWDVSYLASLYGAELNRKAQNQQAGQISALMFRDRRAAQEETPPQ